MPTLAAMPDTTRTASAFAANLTRMLNEAGHAIDEEPDDVPAVVKLRATTRAILATLAKAAHAAAHDATNDAEARMASGLPHQASYWAGQRDAYSVFAAELQDVADTLAPVPAP